MAAAVERWRANRAALAELAIDPRELTRRLELARARGDGDRGGAAPTRARRTELRARLEAGAARRGDRPRRRGAARGARRRGERRAGRRRGRRPRGPRLAGSTRASKPLADRLAGLEAELDDVAAEVRDARRDGRPRPGGARRRSRSGCRLIYAPRAPLRRRRGGGHRPRRAGARRRPSGSRGLEDERARRQADDAGCWPRVADAAAALSTPRARPPGPLGAAVGGGPARARVPGRRVRGRARPAAGGRRRAGGRDRRRRGRVRRDRASTRSSSGSRPNPGEPARPLARIASGGELSRVALAIKQVLAAADATPTLVFDEVDTGIGGRSADPVGRSLWALARHHQVLCVTHLPQIAAHADAHFRIAKRERDGRTITEVERLDREGRIVELAQMLGGRAPAARRRSPRRASCSTAPRRGAPSTRRRRPAERTRRRGAPATLDGRHRATTCLPAGRARARRRARSAPTAPTSRTSPHAPRRGARLGAAAGRRASATSPPARAAAGRTIPGLAPTSLRRRAAAIRGLLPVRVRRGADRASTSPRISTCRASRGSCPRR